MSDDKKQIPASSHQKSHPVRATEAMDDARTRALNEALQSSFKVVRVIMVILAIAFLGSGITKIDNNKRALHLRFGEYIDTLNPGLVWAWPYPIDEIVQIPVNENRTITSDVGWRPRTRNRRSLACHSSRPTMAILSPETECSPRQGGVNFSLDENSDKTITRYEFGFPMLPGSSGRF
ncbi:MAG: hypothetical protein CM1200mP29_04610 [Verrucomicrobiota bacterium]|nr:MAG: hypothetical protein CM1200mP29_04610 [Verrucomicrobiota bacterium]